MVFWIIIIAAAVFAVTLGLTLLKRERTFAGILILMFVAPVFITIMIQYLNHQFPFG